MKKQTKKQNRRSVLQARQKLQPEAAVETVRSEGRSFHEQLLEFADARPPQLTRRHAVADAQRGRRAGGLSRGHLRALHAHRAERDVRHALAA